MANKSKVTPQKEEMPEKEGRETPPGSPLLDLSDAAIVVRYASDKKSADDEIAKRASDILR